MIKILHTADIHLDSPLKSLALRDPDLRDRVQAATRGAFARIVEVALEEKVAALLIAGDLYDGAARSARTAAFLLEQLDRLRRGRIPVFYNKGNHDAENPITGEVALPDNVHVFDGRGGRVKLDDHDVWIHGVSFSGRHAPDSLLGKFSAPVADSVNIAMLHTSLAGAAGHDTYAPCTLSDLVGMGFDYWALGHIHKRQVHSRSPFVVMPGIPQGRDIGEAGAQSATLLSIDDGRITLSEIATSQVTFQRIDLSVAGCEDEDALRSHLRGELRRIAADADSDATILRLRLSGAFARRWQVERDRDTWSALIATTARETGTLWVEKVEFALSDPGETGPDATATAELASFMQTILDEPGFAATLDSQLDDVLAELPAHLRAHLLPDAKAQAALVRRLAGDGARHVTALMKGAAE
ncbi:metallophosphoesterase family protein [Oceaniglobus trochenteri]|uniref:metallophosphoesterase family protein n=1 Tax=Oceaniglobus trochenteri TaxID=2763260 RepID=UPI001CFFA783